MFCFFLREEKREKREERKKMAKRRTITIHLSEEVDWERVGIYQTVFEIYCPDKKKVQTIGQLRHVFWLQLYQSAEKRFHDLLFDRIKKFVVFFFLFFFSSFFLLRRNFSKSETKKKEKKTSLKFVK